jgi:hypothetical protein
MHLWMMGSGGCLQLACDVLISCSIHCWTLVTHSEIFICFQQLAVVSGVTASQASCCKGNPISIDEQLFSQYLVRGNPK